MKTATVTWVSDNNYGTLLQAYALQQTILDLGHQNTILSDASIIDEIDAASKNSSPTLTKVVGPQEKTSLSGRVLRILRHPSRISASIFARLNARSYGESYYDSQYACNNFRDDMLDIMDIPSYASTTSLNDKFDAFICGSDQIWSVLAHRFHPYYFLDFVTKKKIAYAPCMGTEKISLQDLDKIKEYTSGFDGLSVRESISARQLSDLTGHEVAWVSDPTLLHDQTFWSAFSSTSAVPAKKYLLCYFLENKPWYFECAKYLSKRLHLKLILIPAQLVFSDNRATLKKSVGPQEFVGLFQNASYVLTDSYHGSIFSLLFEKDFNYLMRFEQNDPNSQNIRIKSLFDYLELNDRIIHPDMICFSPNHMSYSSISKKIIDFRSCSLKYLSKNLTNS